MGCDDSNVRLWRIPEGGLKEDIKVCLRGSGSIGTKEKLTLFFSEQEPTKKFNAHTHRINVLAFHPLVENLLVTTSPELSGTPSIKYWDIESGQCVLTVSGMKDLVTRLNFFAFVLSCLGLFLFVLVCFLSCFAFFFFFFGLFKIIRFFFHVCLYFFFFCRFSQSHLNLSHSLYTDCLVRCSRLRTTTTAACWR